MVVAEMIAAIGAAARLSAADLKDAAVEARAARVEIDAARDSVAGMTKAEGNGSTNTKQLVAALKAVR